MDHLDAAATEPFHDTLQLFQSSHDLAPIGLQKAAAGANLVNAWEIAIKTHCNAFSACLESGAEFPEATAKVVTHALRLAKTSPQMFGFCFQLQQSTRSAVLSFEPYPPSEDLAMDPNMAQERHDIVQWIASFNLLGKAFSLDEWESVYASSLIEPPMPELTAAKIHYGEEVIDVNQRAMEAMRDSFRALENKPTPYFKQKYVMTAVVQILGKNLLEYMMPQSQDQLKDFDWNQVVPEGPQTYPQPVQPDPADFAKVKAIHRLVQEEQTEKAKAIGLPSGGIQSYSTYLQRWQQGREIHAIYRAMNPEYSLQMVADLVAAQLKLCKSLAKQYDVIKDDIFAHIQKLKNANRKREKLQQVEQDLARAQAQEEAARQRALKLQDDEARLLEEKQQIEETPAEEMGARMTRYRRQPDNDRRKKLALEAKERETVKVVQAREAAEKLAADKSKEKAQLQKERQQAESLDQPARKRTKRNSVERLTVKLTPREIFVNDGDDWLPPTRDGTVYSEPGRKWTDDAIYKLSLLTQLRLHLVGLLGHPLNLTNLMAFIDPDDIEVGFEDKVFIYLMALILRQKRSVASCAFHSLIDSRI
jgi:hypothetical protein